jgi:hypothetical protein
MRIKPIAAMKTIPLILAVLLVAVASQSQPTFQQRIQPTFQQPQRMPPGPGAPAAAAEVPVNYLIRVEWKHAKDAPKFLEVLTTEGEFNLNTIQKNPVKIGNVDVPLTLNFQGTLHVISDTKGRLDLFLGRNVPYVTGSYGSGPNAGSSYSQMQVGLHSSFIVTFGKSLVIQNDENGAVTVIVTRMAD